MATFEVVGDIPDQYSSVGGSSPALGHQILFVTGKGFRGSVFVANDHYTAAEVKSVCQAQADIVDAVNTLKTT